MKFEELEDSQQQVARMIEHAIQKFEVRQEAERLERERRQREAQLEREHPEQLGAALVVDDLVAATVWILDQMTQI